MASTRTSKLITDLKDIEDILAVNEENFSSSLFMDFFGAFEGKIRFNPFDIIEVPVGAYTAYKNGKSVTNKNKFKTTVGKLIFNKYFIECSPQISEVVQFVEDDMTKKAFNKLYETLTYAYMEDRVNLDEYKNFLMKTQQFMPYCNILSESYSESLLTSGDKINPVKKKLIKDNKEAVENGDIFTVDKIASDLLNYSKEILKDDPGLDCFNSGAIGSFDNNFKNLYIMRGATKDPDPTKGYSVIMSSFNDGVTREEYSKLANSLTEGPYSRAVKTSLGGYWEKLFLYAFGHIRLLDEGSDCKTKRYITRTITSSNVHDLMYSFIIENGKLVELNSQNKDKYIGKTVKMRFSSMCESKNGICNACAGNLFYKLGIRDVGLVTKQIPSKLKVISMKKFHDSQVTVIDLGKDIDPMHVFGLD